MLKPSPAHRLLGLQPGLASPKWFTADFCNIHLDAFTLLASALILAVLVCWKVLRLSWPIPTVMGLAAALTFWLQLRFADCERIARARTRRGECVWCGAEADLPHSTGCPREQNA